MAVKLATGQIWLTDFELKIGWPIYQKSLKEVLKLPMQGTKYSLGTIFRTGILGLILYGLLDISWEQLDL